MILRKIIPHRLLTAVAVCCLSARAYAFDQAQELLTDGTQRIDSFIDGFQRTGDMQARLSDLQRAETELIRSVQIFAAAGDEASAALALCKLGDAERMQNGWTQAGQLYDKSYALAKKVNRTDYQTKALIGRARTASLGLHNYTAAITDAAEAVRLSTASADKNAQCAGLGILADAHQHRGELTAAADAADRELATAVELGEGKQIALARLDLADVYLALGLKCDYDTAFNSFTSCYSAIETSKKNAVQALSLAEALGYRGLVPLMRSQLEDAETQRLVIKKREETQRQVEESKLLNPAAPSDVLVTENFSFGRVSEAKTIAAMTQVQAEAVRQAEAAGFPPGPRDAYTKGMIAAMQGHDDEALTQYLRAVDLLEEDRQKLQDESGRGTFLTDKIDVYYKPLMQLLQRRRYAEAFSLLERSRSRAFADSLGNKRLQFSNHREQDLYAQWIGLEANTAKYQGDLYSLREQPVDSELAARIADAEQQIFKLEEQRRALRAQITKLAPKLQSLTVSQPASLLELQRSMRQEGYEALYYLTLDAATIVWHISADSIEVKNVFLPQFEMAKKVAVLRQGLSDPAAEFDEQVARQMFLFLLQPMLPYIHSKRLVIFPQQELNYVPFQVFQDPSDHSYAGERFEFSYAPSATVLLQLKTRPNIAGATLFAVADTDLPAAAHEVDTIAQLYPRTSKVFKDPLLTKAEFKTNAAAYDLVHVAVHGKFQAGEPLLSYIALREGAQDDGRLTAAEMFGLPLEKTRLVVLSACETGRIQATHSNEIQGITRGLLYAGANSLLLSSWKVDSDSTALWMQTFYREGQTQSLPEAARRALVTVKALSQYRHPYYWAPFVVIGK